MYKWVWFGDEVIVQKMILKGLQYRQVESMAAGNCKPIRASLNIDV